MMEFVHDHVSTGVRDSARFHDYSGCGWHYAHFTPEPARSSYRQLVNDILQRIEPGYETTPAGEILRAVPDGVAPLLDTAPRRLEAGQRQHVEAAITKYRARSSTPTDLHHRSRPARQRSAGHQLCRRPVPPGPPGLDLQRAGVELTHRSLRAVTELAPADGGQRP
jgi:hypothetical protein